MSFTAVRNLSPDFVKDVVPKLGSPPPADTPFSRHHAQMNMKKMAEYKEQSMTTYWPHLREAVLVENLKIPMRDGIQRDLRVYKPKEESGTSGAFPVLYLLHGGGFVAGDIDSEDLISRQICSVCNVVVFSLDYRLAPEHPVVPTILNDCEDGLKWTHENASKYGGDAKESVFVGGTSCGATMAATLGFRAESLVIPIKGLILRQPVFILNNYENAAKKEWLPRLKSREENYDSPILGGAMVKKINGLLAVPLEEATNANNFPIYASKEELSRMPPAYFVEAPCDPCVDEVALFADLLRDAGVKVRVQSYEGMPHGFHAHHVLQAARDEMKDTAEGVKWLIELGRKA